MKANGRQLKRRANRLARALKANRFVEAYYAGRHFSAESQRAEIQGDLTRLQRELAALDATEKGRQLPTSAEPPIAAGPRTK